MREHQGSHAEREQREGHDADEDARQQDNRSHESFPFTLQQRPDA